MAPVRNRVALKKRHGSSQEHGSSRFLTVPHGNKNGQTLRKNNDNLSKISYMRSWIESVCAARASRWSQSCHIKLGLSIAAFSIKNGWERRLCKVFGTEQPMFGWASHWGDLHNANMSRLSRVKKISDSKNIPPIDIPSVYDHFGN